MIFDSDLSEDINVQIIDFGGIAIDEQVILNEDGSYTILIDARASYEAQAYAFEHALNHIRNNDFYKDDVQTIEAEAHHIESTKPEQSTEYVQSEAFLKRKAAFYESKKKYLKKRARIIKQLEKKRKDFEELGLDYAQYCYDQAYRKRWEVPEQI